MSQRASVAWWLLILLLPTWASASGVPLAVSGKPMNETVAGKFTDLMVPLDQLFELKHPVTAGDPDLAPMLWQRTWGLAGLSIYPIGDKMAPNGAAYDPLFSLDLLLNVSLTTDRQFYLFGMVRFWAQKPGEGITNASQGVLDFSKRQFDLDGGIAWNYVGSFEARAFAYSFNNLNRGRSLERPFGYNDGFAVENRYYFESTDFDRGLYRFVTVGYYLTKELIGADGQLFHPGFFLGGDLALDLFPDTLYGYANSRLICEKGVQPKLLLVDSGVAFRPFSLARDLEFRIGADTNFDLDVRYTRVLLYANARIIW